MQSRISEIKATGTEVIAISTDTSEVTHAKLGSAGINYLLLADPDLTTIDAYGVRHQGAGFGDSADIARPATFLIDTEGRIIWRELTDNWRIRLRPQRLLDQIAALP